MGSKPWDEDLASYGVKAISPFLCPCSALYWTFICHLKHVTYLKN